MPDETDDRTETPETPEAPPQAPPADDAPPWEFGLEDDETPIGTIH